MQRSKAVSFDHLVGKREQLVRYSQAKCFRGLEVYDQHVFCGCVSAVFSSASESIATMRSTWVAFSFEWMSLTRMLASARL
jgi:hypothetical protein